ncbi:T9SS type A sorting domain-containing protein [Spirosoma taeanense]|uniref:T9SS type A sorting domain-containing protein n=1 Tax=Spirosoma taeanense TaxID=2735870 RepID=A0A6M5YGE9_9BACT|nr:T9SS type A sorting domain-containing protein [Spirosoma taeanense]QJW92002.1 T9SS type A sorting domain-containing protein [Spirosoma taeanense]
MSSYTVGMDNVEGIPWSMVGVTVPATAVIGSLYKVRVSSMRPEGCTKDPASVTGNTVEIRIKSVEVHSIGYLLPPYSGTPKPGPLNISTGQTFRLYAIPERSYYTYTWLLPCPPLCNELAGTRSGVFESTATELGSYTATLYGHFADAYYCDAPVVSTVINVSGSASNGLRVGTEESAGQEGLMVRAWPNPVREVLTVEVQAELRKPVTISMTDARGRLIQRRQTVMEAPKQQELFSLNGQPTGIYLLRVATADKAQVIKIIKDDK